MALRERRISNCVEGILTGPGSWGAPQDPYVSTVSVPASVSVPAPVSARVLVTVILRLLRETQNEYPPPTEMIGKLLG